MSTDKQKTRRKLHRVNNVIFALTLLLGVLNVAYLIWQGKAWDEITFRALQYIAMLLILRLPYMLHLRFRIEVPWPLSVFIVIFCFSALILGDGLDLYGKIHWWDKLLHAESGILLSMLALWLIHIIMAENDKYIYFNRYFLVLFLVMFSVGVGAFWEIIEYTYDSLMGTNTQQFMATTTGSIYTADDKPLCGHEALNDTMGDLILDFIGAFLVGVYGFLRHNRLIERYQELVNQANGTVSAEAESKA